MSGGPSCKCTPRSVHVIHRRCNYSAFSGYHRTPSQYSRVQCDACGYVWRTKASYVDFSPDGPYVMRGTVPPLNAGADPREDSVRQACDIPYDACAVSDRCKHGTILPHRCRDCEQEAPPASEICEHYNWRPECHQCSLARVGPKP